jgi:hypothetical protein
LDDPEIDALLAPLKSFAKILVALTSAAMVGGAIASWSVTPRLRAVEAHREPIEGEAEFKATEAYPKTVVLVDTSKLADVAGKPHYVEGWVDMSELASGETVELSESVVISPTAFSEYAREEYTGPVDPPAASVVTKPAKYGLKIEATMRAPPAADRTLRYQFFVRYAEI